MVKDVHVVEEARPDPAQIVFALICELNAGTYSSMNKTEAPDLLECQRIFKQVHMVWKDEADVCGDIFESGNRVVGICTHCRNASPVHPVDGVFISQSTTKELTQVKIMVAKDQPRTRIKVERRTDLIEDFRAVGAAIDQITQENHDRLGLMITRVSSDMLKHGFEKISASMDVGNSIDSRR